MTNFPPDDQHWVTEVEKQELLAKTPFAREQRRSRLALVGVSALSLLGAVFGPIFLIANDKATPWEGLELAVVLSGTTGALLWLVWRFYFDRLPRTTADNYRFCPNCGGPSTQVT